MSSAELRRALQRKAKRLAAEEKQPPPGAIDVVMAKMERLGFLNDATVAERAVRRWRDSGASKRKVEQKLRQRGLSSTGIDAGDDLVAARIYVRKKRLQEKDRDKALASLGRQGFSYDVAKRALNGDTGDENEA